MVEVASRGDGRASTIAPPREGPLRLPSGGRTYLVSVHAEQTPRGTFVSFRRKTLNGARKKANKSGSIIAVEGMRSGPAALLGMLIALSPIPAGSVIKIQSSSEWAVCRVREMTQGRMRTEMLPISDSEWYVRVAEEALLNSAITARVASSSEAVRARRSEIPRTSEGVASAMPLSMALAEVWRAKAHNLKQGEGGSIVEGWACDTAVYVASERLQVGFTQSLRGGFPGGTLYRVHVDRRFTDRIHAEVVGCLITYLFAQTMRSAQYGAPVIFNDLESARWAVEKERRRISGKSSPVDQLLSRVRGGGLDIRYAPRRSTEALRLADDGTREKICGVAQTVDMGLEEVLSRFDRFSASGHWYGMHRPPAFS